MKNVFNTNHLKIIALITMTIDHIAWLIYPGYQTNIISVLLHIIGRLAFPIFAYCIAEGYHYTHNVNKYMKRLLILAIISHIPYMMASTTFQKYGWQSIIPFSTGTGIERFLNQTSVIWSYFIGLVILQISSNNKYKKVQIPLIIVLCLLSFPSDWSCIGSLIVVAIASNRNNPKKQILSSYLFIILYSLVYYFAISKVYGLIQLCTILAVPIIYLYNGKKGDNKKVNNIMKWLFYIYYPLHLFIIGLIGLLK